MTSRLTDKKCALCGERGDIHENRYYGGDDLVTCGDCMCALSRLPGITVEAWNALSDLAAHCGHDLPGVAP